MLRSKLKTLFLAGTATILAAALITLPKESLQASVRGLDIWWKIVFPSLLPFFIVSEMLIGFGVVKFLGVILEPIMRPLFKVPGAGGFVWAMGMASGLPAGAKFTTRLRQEGQLSKIEAERLVSFTNSSNPLFIFGAVAVGFFHNPNLGLLLALAHYLGNICVGLVMRFYGKENQRKKDVPAKRFNIRLALSALHQTRLEDNRPIGKLLGDAVSSSIQTLLMVGGFIILFSVVNQLLYQLHITAILAKVVDWLLSALSLPGALSIPLISGLFELTLGSQLTSQVTDASLLEKAITTSFILAFSGFSVHAQVASIISQTDIRFKPFFIGRVLQGFFAGLFTVLLWKPVYLHIRAAEQSVSVLPVGFAGKGSWLSVSCQKMIEYGPLFTIGALAVYILILMRRIKET